MRKGFTLIELLAVIIILAVIALIATPIVLNVVNNAKESSRKNSIYGYADGVKLSHLESQFQNEENFDLKISTDNRMNNKTVNCKVVAYCDGIGPILDECKVENVGDYYYSEWKLSTTRPSNMDELLNSCKGEISNSGDPDIEIIKPDYTCNGSVCDEEGPVENVIDKKETEDFSSEYWIYTIGYTTTTDLKSLEYKITLRNLPIDLNQYTLEIVESKLMDTIIDFNSYEYLKKKGNMVHDEGNGNDSVSTAKEKFDHRATATELNIDETKISCSTTDCVINIKESFQNLSNITFHNTKTESGKDINAIYLPIKIKVRPKERNGINFYLPYYAFSESAINKFGDNKDTLQSIMSNPNLQLLGTYPFGYETGNINNEIKQVVSNSGYYVFTLSCKNNEQTFPPVCYNYFMKLYNKSGATARNDDSYPKNGIDNEIMVVRVTNKQKNKYVSVIGRGMDFPNIPLSEVGQRVTISIYFLQQDVENEEIEKTLEDK